MEQRIGRVDRHDQEHRVEVLHFVGAGWQQAAPGSFENDLEYLTRVATKVATEREDLGSVNPVLAAAVEARMLGRPTRRQVAITLLLENPRDNPTFSGPEIRLLDSAHAA